ncbi:hypothetical protein GLV94_05405 [Virgibacillus halodenitrificans]|uniref:peptidoglycan-binding protein n=1 Tax=Virgibacillus halodenitrificans TaxID=1482 RepID=UPI0013718206|nr:peptidoglycan-binding protein [Virgibacillus halodenitrificans]MYL45072.1 hypothetical protein [Virgibacillus halodenitrificans]
MWSADKQFKNGKEFISWLDKHYGDYISKYISELHVHHTWKPNHSYSESLLQLNKSMRNFHVGTRGWSDIGQHTTIGKNGDVILGRNIKIMPASAFGHNGSTNWHPFMFEMIGDFDKGRDRLDGGQLETVMEISKYFHKKGKKIRFHREMDSRKSCPGTGISKSWFMNQVKSNSYTPPKTETKPETVTKPKWNKVTGNWTGQTLRIYDCGEPVGQLQSMLSNNKPPFYPNKDAKNNGIDDYYGDDTADAVGRFQSYYGLKFDEIAGEEVYGQLKVNKPSKPKRKSISQMAQEVIDGKHGNGHANRRKSLGISQNEYNKVRDEVNRIASGTSRKSIAQMANEVIDGKHGNGHEKRRRSLGISSSEYEKVRKEVNKRL